MSELRAEDFAAFFEAIHGHAPFPWQQRLVERLARGDGWPDLMDLPTGVGKTAALDAAIFHLALEATETGTRTAARRIVFVVDRRTIVDQAHRRADKIAKAIDSRARPVLVAVRDRLRRLMRPGPELENTLSVALLRGGMPRSDAWAKTPDQPVVAISTVDQVGSRLLFRGYGVSDGMKPVHAGLLGNDVLWLLDEVHLSEPFRQTLTHIARYRGWADAPLKAPFAVVEMSATPGRRQSGDSFQLAPADREHAVLARRLNCRKPTTLVTGLKGAGFNEAALRETKQAIEAGATAVAIVVNRVQSARDLWRELSAKLKTADVELVTGRMRPLDRDVLERRLTPRIGAGERSDNDKPMVVVATQCIEAGADFDFDVLVTECASLDALRQRFGRLNRLGARDDARGVVLARVGVLKDDPVYGDALAATLAWLEAQPALDFGLAQLRLPEGAALKALVTEAKDAPVLLPGHLDAWAQTAPLPEPDPDVTLWLHGPARGNPEARVVWRADLLAPPDPETGVMKPLDPERVDDIATVLAALPPSPGEALSVPLGALRRWLAGLPEPSMADVEGESKTDDEERSPIGKARLAVRWSRDGAEVIGHDQLRPDDTIIVPTFYGGLTHGTWDPSSSLVVSDLGDEAWFRQRGRAALRLHPAILGALAPPMLDDEQADRAVVGAWVDSARDAAKGFVGETLTRLSAESAKRWRVIRVPRLDLEGPAESFVVLGRKQREVDAEGVSTEGEEGSFTGRAVPLDEHLCGVGEWASDFARRVGLSDALVGDVTLAAAWHDAGKADSRFQQLLHGGDRFKTEVAEALLAKSGTAQNDRRARKRAQQLSGYPQGARHEVLSVALLAGADAIRARAHDWELVLHLVAAHHGHCRPLAPVAHDERPIDVDFTHEGIALRSSSAHGLARLDSGIGERFWCLVRRYGWWGLAWLETLVRLGDHRRSELEQQEVEA